MKTRAACVILASLAALPPGAAAQDGKRLQRMKEMAYVDEKQCFIAIDSNVVSIMPMLALAWLEAESAEKQKRAQEAFDIARQRGCDINAADFAGLSALNHAILRNHADMVQYLLTHGADPDTAIESKDAFNGLTAFTLLDALEKLEPGADRKRVRAALDTRKGK